MKVSPLYRGKSKDRVRIICMDLSQTYRSIARAHFPKALIVADRFHVVRLALHHLLKTCRSIGPELKGRQGVSKLLNKHARNLTDRQAQRLAVYLERWPAIERIYRFKEELMEVLSAKNQSKKQCRSWARCLLDAIAQLQQSGFRACLVLIVSLCQLFFGQDQVGSRSAYLNVRASETT